MKNVGYKTLISYTLSEIEKVRELNVAELAKQFPQHGVFPPILPIGNAQFVNITPEGDQAIAAMGKLWRAQDSQRQQRIDESACIQLATKAFGEVFCRRGSNTQDCASEVKIDFLRRLEELYSAATRTADHSFFCQLPLEPTDSKMFEIGPVTFMTKKAWYAHVRERAGGNSRAVDVIEDIEPEKFSDNIHPFDPLAKSVREHAQQCGWVAVVEIAENEKRRSSERAEFAVRLALDGLGLLFPASKVRYIRGPGDELNSKMSIAVYQLEKSELSIGQSVDAPFMFANTEVEKFLKDFGEFIIIIGRMLEYVTASSAIASSDLEGRWCDALYWFGEARRETVGFIKLVKFGITLDVLANGGGNHGIVKLLEALFKVDEGEKILSDGTTLSKAIEKLYKFGRSQLSHGTRRAILENLPFNDGVAESICGCALIRFAEEVNQCSGVDEYNEFLSVIE